MTKLNAYFGEFGGQFVLQILVPALALLAKRMGKKEIIAETDAGITWSSNSSSLCTTRSKM